MRTFFQLGFVLVAPRRISLVQCSFARARSREIGTLRVDWSERAVWVVTIAVHMHALRGALWNGLHE